MYDFARGIFYGANTHILIRISSLVFPRLRLCHEYSGFSLDGKSCTQDEIASADYVCLAGYILGNRGLCERQHRQPPKVTCPPEFVLNGLSCSKTEEMAPEMVCPMGYESRGGLRGNIVCTLRTVLEGEPICDAGFDLMDGQCVSHASQLTLLRCPGTHRLLNGRCVRSDKYSPQMICAVGTLSGSACWDEEVTAFELVCPPGFELVNGSCIQETAPAQVCPAGFQAQGGACARPVSSPVDYVCPAGSRMVGQECVEVSVSEAESYCPEGFEAGMDGRCHRAITSPVKFVCGHGFFKALDKCVKVDTTSASPVCSNEEYELLGLTCSRTVVVPPENICLQGWIHNGLDCEQVETSNPQLKCPSGFVARGDGCARTLTIEAEKVCAHGIMTEGMCVDTESVAAEARCPSGADIAAGACLLVEKLPRIESCPPGFRQGGSPATCERTMRVPVERTVPAPTRAAPAKKGGHQ